MIGKVAATGSGFGGAMRYLMSGGKDNPDPDRVAWTATRNLLTNDPKFAPRLMRSAATMSTRCKKPVYHLVISWRAEENPTREMMESVADNTVGDLDLAEHQIVYIAHRDTDHQHVHIVVNRVHPETGRTWHASKDYARIEVSLRRQSEQLGLEYVPGRHNDPDKFRDVPRQVRDGEVQANIRHGKDRPLPQLSKQQIVGRRVVLGPAFDNATSWDELRHGLAEHGMRLTAKGQGLVLTGDDGFMKLSDMGKQIRLGMLEERFGESFADFDQRRTAEQQQSTEQTDATPEVQPRTGNRAERDEPKKNAEPRHRPDSRRTPDEDEQGEEQHDFDEDLREQQREEARLRREQRVASTPIAGAADTTQDDAPPNALFRDTTAGPADDKPEVTPRAAAFEQLASARGTLDIARAMHKMGIINDAQLKKSKDEVAAARKNLDPHLTVEEKMAQGVWEALKDKAPAHKPKEQSATDRKKLQAKEALRLKRKKKCKQKRQDPEQEQGR